MTENTKTKICSNCGRKNILDDFYKSPKMHDGYTSKCKVCIKRASAKYRKNNPDLHKKYKRTPEYRSWDCMIRRCTNFNDNRYKDYGGRGIKVCDRWLNSFKDFLADMGERPKPKELYSIDRTNNDGNYCPVNCKWSTRKEQTNNRSNMKWFRAYNKELNAVRYSKNQSEFAKEWNLSSSSISGCLYIRYKSHKGWTFTYLNQPV